MKCQHCRREFPDELIAKGDHNGRVFSGCALCGLKERNRLHRLIPTAPFSNPIAKTLFEKTRQHYVETKQRVSRTEELVGQI